MPVTDKVVCHQAQKIPLPDNAFSSRGDSRRAAQLKDSVHKGLEMDRKSKETACFTLVANCLIAVGLIFHCSSLFSDGSVFFSLHSEEMTLTDFLLAAGIAVHLSIGSGSWLPCSPKVGRLIPA